MLGVEAEVVGLEALVAGEDVVALVPGERLAADGVKHLPPQDEEQSGDGEGDPETGLGWAHDFLKGGNGARIAIF
jgi:hypothetical protein